MKTIQFFLVLRIKIKDINITNKQSGNKPIEC